MPDGLDVHIPSSVADAIALPDDRKASEVKSTLAIALYREGLLSFGKTRELADLSPYAFAQLLGTQGVDRHYGDTEFEEDMAYAQAETST